jgi:hypothetical protein
MTNLLLDDAMRNDALNEEISKLLAENAEMGI